MISSNTMSGSEGHKGETNSLENTSTPMLLLLALCVFAEGVSQRPERFRRYVSILPEGVSGPKLGTELFRRLTASLDTMMPRILRVTDTIRQLEMVITDTTESYQQRIQLMVHKLHSLKRQLEASREEIQSLLVIRSGSAKGSINLLVNSLITLQESLLSQSMDWTSVSTNVIVEKYIDKLIEVVPLVTKCLTKWNGHSPPVPSSVISYCINSCEDVQPHTADPNGSYSVQLCCSGCQPRRVTCDMITDGGGWTVIQRRNVSGGTSIPFTDDYRRGFADVSRSWDDYIQGFEDVNSEFWIGLDALHFLTQRETSLRIVYELESSKSTHVLYRHFSVGGSEEQYKLRLCGFTSPSIDSVDLPIDTQWRDMDCVEEVGAEGGWWQDLCLHARHNSGGGIVWDEWVTSKTSIKMVTMMIRSLCYPQKCANAPVCPQCDSQNSHQGKPKDSNA